MVDDGTIVIRANGCSRCAIAVAFEQQTETFGGILIRLIQDPSVNAAVSRSLPAHYRPGGLG